MKYALAAVATLMLTAPAIADEGWRSIPADQLLVIDTSKGRVLVELHPELAPKAVERIVALSRKGFYDGLQFHRVIDGFVAQAGNPDNKDGGKSEMPNLPPEFAAKLKPEAGFVKVTQSSDALSGFVGTLPVGTASAAETARRGEGTVQTWGAYCPGVAGMGRDEAFDSANSEIFFMRGSARRLDRLYTVFGMTISGYEIISTLTIGEPPAAPDTITRMKLAADLPEGERPFVEIMTADNPDFRKLVDDARTAKGADFTICDITVPVRVK